MEYLFHNIMEILPALVYWLKAWVQELTWFLLWQRQEMNMEYQMTHLNWKVVCMCVWCFTDKFCVQIQNCVVSYTILLMVCNILQQYMCNPIPCLAAYIFLWFLTCILHYTLLATCDPVCENGGTCAAPDTCECLRGYTGDLCENGMF